MSKVTKCKHPVDVSDAYHPPMCCHLDCAALAEFVIYDQGCTSDNDTYACENHVGALLSDGESVIVPIEEMM